MFILAHANQEHFIKGNKTEEGFKIFQYQVLSKSQVVVNEFPDEL